MKQKDHMARFVPAILAKPSVRVLFTALSLATVAWAS
jgi:hypothetical protein